MPSIVEKQKSNLKLHKQNRDQPIMLIFYLLCYAPVLKFLTYYAQYYAHVKDLCLKIDCFIRVYSLVYCFIRVYICITVVQIIIIVYVLLEYIDF